MGWMDVGEKQVRNRLPLSLPLADVMEFATSVSPLSRDQEEAESLMEQRVSENRWLQA